MCGVEVRRGGLGAAYLFPTLSVVGASIAGPFFRLHTPLIEPDRPISGIRLSEGLSQVSSFMFLMPVLIYAWYHLIGWLLDRWSCKHLRQS
jgi:hypothetical protein